LPQVRCLLDSGASTLSVQHTYCLLPGAIHVVLCSACCNFVVPHVTCLHPHASGTAAMLRPELQTVADIMCTVAIRIRWQQHAHQLQTHKHI
jgi:hypothetical protein